MRKIEISYIYRLEFCKRIMSFWCISLSYHISKSRTQKSTSTVRRSNIGLFGNTELRWQRDNCLQIHLFDISIEGDITFRESDTFAAGSDPTIVDTGLIEISNQYCFSSQMKSKLNSIPLSLQKLVVLELAFAMILASLSLLCCTGTEVGFRSPSQYIFFSNY